METGELEKRLRRDHPELDRVRAAAAGAPVYLVGGAVRDLLLGRRRSDVDLVVVGDAAALAAALDAEPREHERFATAKVVLDGHEIDLASARSETYAHPGALPDVRPAASIEEDLRRRDFTINAMALPLDGAAELVDPLGGRSDLEAGLLRVLHGRSFVDDPTRALRAARYAARFGFSLEPETERLLRAAELETVSADRRRAELLLLADEPTAARGFELLAEWGLLELRPRGVELATRVADLLGAPPWRDSVPREQAVLAAALGHEGADEGTRAAAAKVERLAAAVPASPSAGAELALGADPVELVLARALGAEWLDRHLGEWRHVKLEIDGEDLIGAGLRQGPAIGRGLAAALRAKLDGEISGRDQELNAALSAAREALSTRAAEES